MSGDEAVADPRQRILSALASAMGVKALDDVTVDDLVDRARVSREVFGQHFDSVRDCWRAGFEDLARRLEGALATDLPGTGAPLGRFDALLVEFLGALAADTAASAVYLAQLQTADPHVTARRIELQTQFVSRLADIFDAHTTTGRFACQVVAAATTNLTTQALLEGDAESVRNLRRPLVLFAEQTLT